MSNAYAKLSAKLLMEAMDHDEISNAETRARLERLAEIQTRMTMEILAVVNGDDAADIGAVKSVEETSGSATS